MEDNKHNIEELIHDKSFVLWTLNTHDEKGGDHKKWERIHKENPGIINEARSTVKSIHSIKVSYPGPAKEKLWQRIKLSNLEHELNSEIHLESTDSISPKMGNGNLLTWSFIAAAVIAVFVAVQFLFNEPEKVVAPPVVTEIIKSNPAGQKSQVHLPDGSTVYLNAESELRYTDNFASDKREVFLQGEAFFDVTKDANSPFSVHTDQLTTTVLGTSFNINSYASEKQIEVALVSGKVLVQDSNENSVHLSPGEKATLDKEKGTMEKGTFDSKKTLLWKDGIIYFDKTNLADAIKILERWYNVEIKVNKPSNETLTCSGQFKKEYLNNVLNNLGFSLGFTYKIQNKNVTINFN